MKLYIKASGFRGNFPIIFRDREKLDKFLNKHRLYINGNFIAIKDYKKFYSKRLLKKIFNKISKQLKRGYLIFELSDKIKKTCYEDRIYIIIIPNKVIWDYLYDNDICDYSYNFLTEKIFPYLDKQTKQDFVKYISTKITSLNKTLEKYELLIHFLSKEEKANNGNV